MTFLTESEKNRIATIHTSAYRGVFVVTGGGGEFLGKLLLVPGASQTVLEMIVPYSFAAIRDFLQAKPEHYCCAATARKLAVAAWYRARKWAEQGDEKRLLGLGLTATLATNRPHTGQHRVYLAIHTCEQTLCYARYFTKEGTSREEEEQELTAWALEILENRVRECPGRIPLLEFQEAASDWQELLCGKRLFCNVSSENSGKKPVGLFPGSFAPIHEGHCRILAVARELLAGDVGLELAVCNADKPPLDYVEIARRLEGIRQRKLRNTPVFLTATPYFEQKAATFPETTFLVGADTINRIAEPRFYGGETARMETSIRKIAEYGGRFLVFGRWDGEKFVTLEDLTLPPLLKSLCRGVPEVLFRKDISSTLLRRQLEVDSW
ncbi:MAG: hypothetical protein Q4D62_12330 [Planctomycetia bacterium]|nr:hypothetical protein [Planctomycetia bacterium]